MKVKIVFLFLIFLLFPNIAYLRENVNYWYIKDFYTEIKINQDSSLSIVEKIIADCGRAEGKHGIFRSIPLVYKTSDKNFRTPVSDIIVSDFSNNNLKYQETKNYDVLTLKIGDPNIRVKGENYYSIKYSIQNAIRFENENFSEFYWNILGNFWDLEIDKFAAKIFFPEGFNKEESEFYYYSGLLGEKNDSNFDYNWIDERTLFLTNKNTIKIGEGLTVSVTMPSDLTIPYVDDNRDSFGFIRDNYRGPFSIVRDNLHWLLPLLVLFNLFVIFLIYRKLKKIRAKHPKKYKINKPIIAEFSPPENISPLEMSFIIVGGNFKNSAITASIISLAVKGYLKIEAYNFKLKFFGTKYKLIRTDKDDFKDLYIGEKEILDIIFKKKKEVSLSSLSNSFYKEIPKLNSLVLKDFYSRNIILEKTFKLKKNSLILGLVLLVFSPFFSWFPPLFFVSICSIMIIYFSYSLPARSEFGEELKWRSRCFKLYLKTAEKYRSRFNEKEGIMEKFLPYAILFGMTKKWLNKMKDLYGEDFSRNYNSSFLVGVAGAKGLNSFISSIDSVSRSISSNTSPSSSGSSGGGSSGGGGGGGGGGGW